MLVHQAANAKRTLQAKRDFRLHVGQLLLEKLGAGQRLAELLAIKTVLGARRTSSLPPHPVHPRKCHSGRG